MGYESRLYIVNVRRDTVNEPFAEVIGTVDLSKMFEDFPRIFTTPIDYDVAVDLVTRPGEMMFTNKDRYGDHMKSASAEVVAAYLENAVAHKPYYRRIQPALDIVRAFIGKKNVWDAIEVVHYRY